MLHPSASDKQANSLGDKGVFKSTAEMAEGWPFDCCLATWKGLAELRSTWRDLGSVVAVYVHNCWFAKETH